MDRIKGAGHINNLFVAEDAGLNRPPTEITAPWLNAIQEELARVIESTGVVLDGADNGQLLTAIQLLIETRVGDFTLDTGTANAKLVALNPTINAYTDNFGGAFRNTLANTGAVTIDFGPGAVPLVSDAGAPLVAGDLPAGNIIGYQYVHADGVAYVTTVVASMFTPAAPPPPVAIANKFVSAEQAIVSGGTGTLPHGLAGRPALITLQLKCVIAEQGWSVGDIKGHSVGIDYSNILNIGVEVWADTANVYFRANTNAGVFVMMNKSTGAQFSITNANWRMIFTAWL